MSLACPACTTDQAETKSAPATDSLMHPIGDSSFSHFGLTDQEWSHLHLLTLLYRCRSCFPNKLDDLYGNQRDHHANLKTPCCPYQKVKMIWPPRLPDALIPLTCSFLEQEISESFLTNPIPQACGPVQCKVIKDGTRFELFLEIKDKIQFLNARVLFVENNAEREKSVKDEMRRLITKGVFHDRTERIPESIHSSNQMSLGSRLNATILKSGLLDKAEDILFKNKDVFLMSAKTGRFAWQGYNISKEPLIDDRMNENKIIGKLQSRLGGRAFALYDFEHTVKEIKKQDRTVKTFVKVPREVGIVQFTHHFFEQAGNPIRMKVLIPNRSFYHNKDIGTHLIYPTNKDTIDPATRSISAKPWWQSILNFFRLTPSILYDGKILLQYHAEEKHREATRAQSETKTTDQQRVDDDARSASNLKCNIGSQLKPPPERNSIDPHAFFSFETTNQEIEVYENLRPVWHDPMGAYVLHFDEGRVKAKSVKNFKLVRVQDDSKRTALQFGRVIDRNVFILDMQYPMTPLQAFSIALASIDPKYGLEI